MLNKLGYIKKFPKDYSFKKYIAFPNHIQFSIYLDMVGYVPVYLLENQINLEGHDIHFLPFKVNIFDRKTFMDFMIDNIPTTKKDIALRVYKEMEYIEEMKECH